MQDCFKSIARTWSSSPAIYQWQNSQNEANILNPIVLTKLLGVSVCSYGRWRKRSREKGKDGIVGGQGGDQRRLGDELPAQVLIVMVVSMCLVPLHLLHSSHYIEPFLL
jgi:hypothetical protein